MNEPSLASMAAAVAAFDTDAIRRSLDHDGCFVSDTFIDAAGCEAIARLYEDPARFRSTVTMARHGFGKGEYKYFGRPLPPIIATLRATAYAKLAPIANTWALRLRQEAHWPDDHGELVARCAAAGQTLPTPLLLRYGPGDHNCLHRDLYGAIHFPLQAIVLLDEPGTDFQGGELLLVEQRPRRQSRPIVVPLTRGAMAIIPVQERPIESTRGTARTHVRHGVSQVRSGLRRTLGLIFHDAAP